MPPMGPPMNSTMIIVEFVLALAAVIFCLLIYFKTRESYNLTKHLGIRYFRDAFLFLGLAYLLRFTFSLISIYGLVFDIFLPRNIQFPLSIMLTGYLSTVGLIYLILSSSWKYLGKNHIVLAGHLIAIFASVFAFFTRSLTLLMLLQILLLALFIVATILFSKKESGKKAFTKTKAMYFLVAILWFTNLFTTGKPIFSREIDLLFQVIAIALFAMIYIRVLKWLQ